MMKILSTATFVVLSACAQAQTQSGPTTPGATPSQPTAVPQNPATTTTAPASGATAPAGDAPVVGGPAPSVGGIESRPLGALSQCDNLIGLQKEKCLQAESAARGSTAPAATPR